MAMKSIFLEVFGETVHRDCLCPLWLKLGGENSVTLLDGRHSKPGEISLITKNSNELGILKQHGPILIFHF